MTATIRSIDVVARLDTDAEIELTKARARAAAGDDDWARWLREYEEGAALLVRINVVVSFEAPDGDRDTIAVENRGLWVEDHAHPPKVALQIAELAHKDFPQLADDLRARGIDIVQNDLEEMFVGATLGDDVLEALSQRHRHKGEGVRSSTGLT